MLQRDPSWQALSSALDPNPSPVPAAGDRLAAVMVPLIGAEAPSLVFTMRAEGLSRHAGEISFPGGLQDPGETLAETAEREALEEIGMVGAEMLGALPAVHTFVSAILMVPFVAALERVPEFVKNEGEIERILTFRLADLARAEEAVEYPREGGRVWWGWAYRMDGDTIWGATGMVLHSLLQVARKETSWMTGS
jgi:8-oxo-dGTP pyrophosphatase MutT (NUDIX family)